MREAHLFTDDIEVLAEFARRAPAGVQLKTDCNPDLNPDPTRAQTCFSVPAKLSKGFELAAAQTGVEMAWGASPTFSVIALDISDVQNPVEINRVATSMTGTVDDIRIQGHHLYLCDSSNISVVDISTPNAMFEAVGSATSSDALFPQGDKLYSVDDNDFFIYDISDFDAVTQVGTVSTGTSLSVLSVKGSFAYTCDNVGDESTASSLVVISIDDELNPSVYSTTTLTGMGQCSAMLVTDTKAYILGNHADNYEKSKLIIVDINEPDAPAILGTLSANDLTLASGGADDLVLVDETLIITGNEKLLCVDVSDHTDPRLMTVSDTLDESGSAQKPSQMDIQGRHLFVPARNSGELYIYRVGGSQCHAAHINHLRSDKIYSAELSARHINATVDVNAFKVASGDVTASYTMQLGPIYLTWFPGDPNGDITVPDIGYCFTDGSAASNIYFTDDGGATWTGIA